MQVYSVVRAAGLCHHYQTPGVIHICSTLLWFWDALCFPISSKGKPIPMFHHELVAMDCTPHIWTRAGVAYGTSCIIIVG